MKLSDYTKALPEQQLNGTMVSVYTHEIITNMDSDQSALAIGIVKSGKTPLSSLCESSQTVFLNVDLHYARLSVRTLYRNTTDIRAVVRAFKSRGCTSFPSKYPRKFFHQSLYEID